MSICPLVTSAMAVGSALSQLYIQFTDKNLAGLHRLFLGLPRKCIVVIEDIDSAGIGREQGPSTKPRQAESMLLGLPVISSHPPETPWDPPRKERQNRVTLSGLLNAIDGNASQEGNTPFPTALMR